MGRKQKAAGLEREDVEGGQGDVNKRKDLRRRAREPGREGRAKRADEAEGI